MVVAALKPILTAGYLCWPVLAQSPRVAHNQRAIWFYLLMLLIAMMVVIIIGVIARKMLTRPIEPDEGEAAFGLSELRRLHREGQLTDEEFQAARAAVLKDGVSYMVEADTPPAHPPAAAPKSRDIELGPELVDPPDEPEESDKPDQAPPPSDNPPKN